MSTTEKESKTGATSDEAVVHVLGTSDGGESQTGGAAEIPESHRGLRMRHVQLIAISGSIGSAVFISIGNPLTSAGPLGLLIGLGIWCTVVWAASNCLIEMTTLLPCDGGFLQYATRFVDPSFGMALGWNYAITQWALICYDTTAINVICQYWGTIHPAIMVSVTLVILGALNLYSVRWYGEAEFWLSITKIILMFGLTLYTFVTMVGGNPLHDVYGFRFWKDPGVFGTNVGAREQVRGIFDAICWGTFAIVGPDYLSIVGGEVRHPRRVLPRAFNTTPYRIFFFYLTGALCVGIASSSNDQSLLGAIAAGAPGAAKSPYVISMNRLGIPVLPSIVNAVVLISCMSTANSFAFVGSRSLFSLAQKGQAPRIFTRVNRNGVPYLAVIATLLLGCLSYLSVSTQAAKVLNWWISLTGSAQLVTWTCVAITYIRFRAGLKKQNLFDTDFLPQRGHLQPFSAWWLLTWSPIVFIFSGYYCFIGPFATIDFVFVYGSGFIFAAIYLGAKAYDIFVRKQTRFWIKAEDIDFVTDIQHFNDMAKATEAKMAAKREKGTGVLQKIDHFLF